MIDEIIYMTGVIVACFAVNFLLRALPFILFSRVRELPRWVTRVGDVLSPIIIAGLVIYSFSGLEWRGFAPYLAGTFTVVLQLWKKNPLISILLGTVLYMILLQRI